MDAHPVEAFWSRLGSFNAYPPDVVPVPELLPGTAAFAASTGLYRPPASRHLPPFPFGGLMIVGHNLDSRSGYERRLRSGVSHGDLLPGVAPMGTWRGLYRLLEWAQVGLDEFFFTNVFVGLKEGKPTGRFIAHPAPHYRRWCRDFLGYQVDVMKPRAVLVLGGPACSEVAEVITPQPWPTGRLPTSGAVRARFYGHETMLVPAHHPSMQKRIGVDGEALRAVWREPDA